MEQIDVLEHEAEISHQAVHIVLAHVIPSERHAACVHIPEARQQLAQRRFAAAGGSDNRCGCPFGNVQSNTVDDGLFTVGKVNILRPEVMLLRANLLPEVSIAGSRRMSSA